MDDQNSRLFETETRKGGKRRKVFATTVFVCILWIWVYRATHLSPLKATTTVALNVSKTVALNGGRTWYWNGMFVSELLLGLYWMLTQSVRWNPTYRRTFKQRLAERFKKNCAPGHTWFWLRPWVISTVLSVMAYDYPTNKLAVYLSDDAGSELTFFALTQAAVFSKHWLPYCRKYKVEPLSTAAYFKSGSRPSNTTNDQDFDVIKNLFERMKRRVEIVTKIGRVPKELRVENKGFAEWDAFTSPRDHDAIVEILLDNEQDVEGQCLPKLVYMAREKKPNHFHNFKAGAMNALIRVSSKISNGPIILDVDCDTYSNSRDTIRDTLCFFMDEEKGHEIGFVQYPQSFENLTKNELYGGSLRVTREIDFHGFDGMGGPLYIGTGCFHRREILPGKSLYDGKRIDWNLVNDHKDTTSENTKEELKKLATCTFETDTEWGKEIGLKYGCPAEDVITGLSIHCQGWKSVFYNPKQEAFLGVAATTLDQTLVQHKRWSKGGLLILLSKYSPAWYGLGKIHPGQLMGYMIYCLRSLLSIPTLYYTIVPSVCLTKGVSLFPKVSSVWFIPFAYIMVFISAFSFLEFLQSGGTTKGWWNNRRIWLYKRTTSYFFALLETIFGSNDLSFAISLKGPDSDVFYGTADKIKKDVKKRYDKEVMEFGVNSHLSTTLVALSLVYMLCFFGIVIELAFANTITRRAYFETMAIQIVLCVTLVLINIPLYLGIYRHDRGGIPSVVSRKSTSIHLIIFFTVFRFVC